ncbi:MAG: hypothetical protein R3B07_35840 [Polyangiaceae bacterium]
MTTPCLQFYTDDTEPTAERPCECCGVTTPEHRFSCSLALPVWWLQRRTLERTPYQAALSEAMSALGGERALTDTQWALLRSHGARGSAASPILTTPEIAEQFGLSRKNSTQKFP